MFKLQLRIIVYNVSKNFDSNNQLDRARGVRARLIEPACARTSRLPPHAPEPTDPTRANVTPRKPIDPALLSHFVIRSVIFDKVSAIF
jgi:hypothetical protein